MRVYILRIAATVAVAAVFFTVSARAQGARNAEPTSCTAMCTCGGSSCSCSTGGGAGSKAVCPGDGTCTVFVCNEERPSLATPQGSLQLGPVSAVAVRWEAVTPGHAVARNCVGLLVAQFFDRGATRVVRRETEALLL